MPLNEGATNDILPFAPDGAEAVGDLISVEAYSAHPQRLRGHQPGMALRGLENRVLRQLSSVAVGLGQYIANRHAAGVTADPTADDMEAGLAAATGSEKVRHTIESADIEWSGDADAQLTEAIARMIAAYGVKGYKIAVRAVATSAIALAGLPTIDGVVLAAGDRVLVAAQADGIANGIYVAAAGAWTRATDADDGDELAPGTVVPVIAGTQAGDSLWLLSSDGAVTIGTTATTWARVGGDGLPLGSIIMHSGPAAPAGYLIANGAAVARATYTQLDAAMYVGDALNATAPAWYRCTDNGNPAGSRAVDGAWLVLPDYRGVMLRGLDLGRGLDPDGARVVNAYQEDALQGHTFAGAEGAIGWDKALGSGTNNAVRLTAGTKLQIADDGVHGTPRVSTETRGKNVAVLICIKAFSAATNPGLIDITALANEVAGLVPYSAFTGANQMLGASGYQRLPGGLILQWGTASATGQSVTTVTLPIAMPTGLLAAYASVSTANTNWTNAAVARAGANGASLTTITVGMDLEEAANANILCWFAICY